MLCQVIVHKIYQIIIFFQKSPSQDERGVVTVLEDHRHGLEDGDFVAFSDIRGMTELNTSTSHRVNVTGLPVI
jgi:hypothetical protein